jgi:hypothetical protein
MTLFEINFRHLIPKLADVRIIALFVKNQKCLNTDFSINSYAVIY